MHAVIHDKGLSGLCVSMVFLFLILLPSGCGDPNQSSSQDGRIDPALDYETASVGLTINWHDAPELQDSSAILTAALDCQAGNIDQVVCEVYDGAGNWLVRGGPWRCLASGGRIDRIPVGQNRYFVVLAEDVDGNIRYHGQTSGISIEAGKVTENIVIDAYLFIPELSSPEDDATVGPDSVSLEWEFVENADEYLVQVAEDSNFETIIVDETTPATVYAPSALIPSMQYYWKIAAVDLHANIGAESEVRRFVTTDCTYSISPASQSVDAQGGAYDVTVMADHSDCAWTISEDYDWISLSPTSGSGDGTVRVTVSENSGEARSATITIAGQTHTINQVEGFCSYSISPSNKSIDAEEDEYNVQVEATSDDCVWTTSENYSWISLLPTSGSGDGSVRVTVSENSGEERSATITIAGQTHTIDQDPADCTYSISPTSQLVDADGEAYDVTVTATHNGCDWTASEDDDWISLSPTSGSGDGTVRVTVSANYGNARSARITIASLRHTVDQEAEAIDVAPPTVPTGVSITPMDDYISVDWDPSTDDIGVEEYRLDFCMGAGGQCDDYWTTLVSHPTTYLEWESEPDTLYCVRIQACDAANNCSEFSETVCTQTP